MPQEQGRGRLIAFRVVAVIAGVLHALPIVFLIISLLSVKERIHVIHNTAGFAVFAAVVALGWILAAVSPERMIGPFQAATLAVLAVAVASAISKDLQGGLITVALAAVLVALHPARPSLVRMGRTAPAPLALAVLAAAPAVGFVLSNATLQRGGAPTDPHIEMHHWTGMAAFALTMPLAAIIAGLGGRNRRIVALSAGMSAALFGIISLSYSGYPGAVSTPWAIACVVWGVALGGDGYRMGHEPGSGAATASAEPA